MSRELQVIIAEDHPGIRKGLRLLLQRDPGINVVAETDNGIAVIKLAADVPADVIVMDINMPGLNGIEACAKVTAGGGRPRVIAFSGHIDAKLHKELCSAGATGFVLKTNASESLVQAIKTVAGGGVYLAPVLAEILGHPEQ